MGTITEKLDMIAQTKEAIRQAISGKGVSIPASTPFSDYPTKIASIGSGIYDEAPSIHGQSIATTFKTCQLTDGLLVIPDCDISTLLCFWSEEAVKINSSEGTAATLWGVRNYAAATNFFGLRVGESDSSGSFSLGYMNAYQSGANVVIAVDPSNWNEFEKLITVVVGT